MTWSPGKWASDLPDSYSRDMHPLLRDLLVHKCHIPENEIQRVLARHLFGRREIAQDKFLHWMQAAIPDLKSKRILQVGCGNASITVPAEQVWEHLKYPGRSTRHVLQRLALGGYFMLTVPFLVRLHPHPTGCTCLLAGGLKYFLEDAGFPADRIQTDSWNNLTCATSNHYQRVSHDHSQNAQHDLKIDPMFTLMVWGLTQKAGAQ